MRFYKYSVNDIENQLVTYVQSLTFMLPYRAILADILSLKKEIAAQDQARIAYLREHKSPSEIVDVMCMLYDHEQLSKHDDITSDILLTQSPDQIKAEYGYEGIYGLKRELVEHIKRMKHVRRKIEKLETAKEIQAMIDKAKRGQKAVFHKVKKHRL